MVPILAILLLAYTLYKNAVGLEAPYSWFPYLVGVRLIVGDVIWFEPGLQRRVTEPGTRTRHVPAQHSRCQQVAAAVSVAQRMLDRV